MKQELAESLFSPRGFLKARKPERFSDSVAEQIPVLDRSQLEYQLETLTSRSQETDFQNFARKLAEREICPNLLPQTGPTGGGDSKVDAETYPVADALSLAWFSGSGREAAQERWGFAFSAMKKWRPKLYSDMAKIAGTGRGYRKAFFVTNQFVADRVRADVEDELSKQHGFDVRVLDRTWILDKVFTGRHESLAIDELRLKTSVRTHTRKGPNDLQKESELEIVEARIKSFAQEGGARFAFVADCIEAIELSRGLELARTEIEGRMVRAKRAAAEHGTEYQQLLVAYQCAWTAFFWFEDYRAFSDYYAEAEKHAVGSRNVYDLELLFNLWCNLLTSVRFRHLTLGEGKFDARTRALATALDRLKGEPERASSALQAETLRLMMDLMHCPPEKADSLLAKLADGIERCEGLVGFPLEPLVQILTEMGDFFGECPAYDKLYARIVETVAKRRGEVAAACLLLRRGAQQLDADKLYEGIRTLGQALRRLFKDESRENLVRALYLLGNAYERVGLVWAARGTLLTAASLAAHDFWTYEEVTPAQAACFNRLKWIELKLGRLPHAMLWHETASSAQNALGNQGYDLRRLALDAVTFDSCAAILLLKSDLWQLKQTTKLPYTLEELDLQLSAAALRFALGHDGELPKGLGVQESERPGFFRKLRDQPAAKDMPEAPMLCNERKVSLKSRVLGCTVCVEAENQSPCIELAESTLAAMEALLATGMEHRFFAREPVLTIKVSSAQFAAQPFEFKIQDHEGRPHVEISSAAFHAQKMSHDEQRALKDKLIDLLVRIMARVFIIDVSEEQLRRLILEELALERSIDFTSSFVTAGNVLGYAPKTTLDSWIETGAQDYPIRRVEEWDAADRKANSATASGQRTAAIKKGEGEPPATLWQGSASHAQMETLSLIRMALWDRADWAETAFLWEGNNQAVPVLALMFRDRDAGVEIFTHWQKELGKVDKRERLRLTIIRGISKKNIYAYRVVVGSNPETNPSGDNSKLLFMVNRRHTMEPSSDRNLSAFLANYNVAKSFIFAPAVLRDDCPEPELLLEKGMLKRELNVRQAWEIGRHDVDSPGISEDDEPIIPEGQTQAPVLSVIRWLQECRGSST